MTEIEFPKPICCKCNKEVEEMKRYHKPETIQEVFTVKCHGETEETILDKFDIHMAINIHPGFAFVQTALPFENNFIICD
jgi:hypothetical protein